MKRTIISLFVFATMLVVGLVFRSANGGLVRSAQAGERGCRLDTLQGEYLYTGRADRAPDDPATTFPRVFAGVWTFDGEGNLTQFETFSGGGQIFRRVTRPATYTLDSDCTGTLHFLDTGANYDLFVSRDGSEGNAVRYDDGHIATRSFKRR